MQEEAKPRAATIWANSQVTAPVDVDDPNTTNARNIDNDIELDERIVLFTTAARRTRDGKAWVIPVHGRVFRPTHGRTAKAALALALKTGFGVRPGPSSRQLFDERCALMLGDNQKRREIVVSVGTSAQVLVNSGRNGQFRGSLTLAADLVEPLARNGRLPVIANLGPRDHRRFVGEALLVEQRGLSVISDIDDTVKVTHVSDRRRMMARTFLHAFEAVPGMAARYRDWLGRGATFHFVSSSPWTLYEPLQTFLETAGFPAATKTLKDVGLRDRSIRNFLTKPTKTKPPAIEALLAAFPMRRFVLIGDSAENDAEIYADIATRHRAQIARILIRDCGGSAEDRARVREAFRGLDAGLWQIFGDAAELPASLG